MELGLYGMLYSFVQGLQTENIGKCSSYGMGLA